MKGIKKNEMNKKFEEQKKLLNDNNNEISSMINENIKLKDECEENNLINGQ